MMDNEGCSSFILEFMRAVDDQVIYAIERNIESTGTPLLGDIDLLINKQDFDSVLAIARDAGLLVSVARAYGGARIYIGREPFCTKRIDCIWYLHYRGIPLLAVGPLLAGRVRDSRTGLFVLPEKDQATAAWAIKTAYGGTGRYTDLFQRHGLELLSAARRRAWLARKALARPVTSLAGVALNLAMYLRRLAEPTGVIVCGVEARLLRGSRVLEYLFQGHIRESGSVVSLLLRSRMFSELCVTGNRRLAQISIPENASVRDCEQLIFDYLQARSGVVG